MTNMPRPEEFEADLLPASSTRLERVLEKALRLPPEVWKAAGRVGDVKTDLSDETVPFMIWELGLEPIMPYISEPRRALKDGREWQRVRGTPASIAIALNWIGKKAFVEEDADGSWWDLFQLGLDEIPETEKQITDIVGLTRLSKASNTDLIRIYSGYDLRAARLNHGRINGDCLINDWSGVWIKPRSNSVSGSAKESDWPKLSFGRFDSGRVKLTLEKPMVLSGWTCDISGRFNRVQGFRFNTDIINGPELKNSHIVPASAMDTEIAHSGDYSNRYGGYPHGKWSRMPYGKPMPTSYGAQHSEISLLAGKPIKRLNPQFDGFRINHDKINGNQPLAGTVPDETPEVPVKSRSAIVAHSAIVVDVRQRQPRQKGELRINSGALNRDRFCQAGEALPPKHSLAVDADIAACHDSSGRKSDWPPGGYPIGPWTKLPYGVTTIANALLKIKSETAQPQNGDQ